MIVFERLLDHLVHAPEHPDGPSTQTLCGLPVGSEHVIVGDSELVTCAMCFEALTSPERRATRGPEGVRLVMTDGAEVPAEIAYSHTDPDGMRVYYVTTEIDVTSVRSILIDVLPRKTVVVIGRRQAPALRVLGEG